MRAAYCYEAAAVVVKWRKKVRHCTDTPKAWRHLPLYRVGDLKPPMRTCSNLAATVNVVLYDRMAKAGR